MPSFDWRNIVVTMIENLRHKREMERLARENLALRSMCAKLNRRIHMLEEDNRALQSALSRLDRQACKKDGEIAFYLFS